MDKTQWILESKIQIYVKYRPLAEMSQVVVCGWRCLNHNWDSWNLFFSELPNSQAYSKHEK